MESLIGADYQGRIIYNPKLRKAIISKKVRDNITLGVSEDYVRAIGLDDMDAVFGGNSVSDTTEFEDKVNFSDIRT